MPSKIRGGNNDKHMADMHVPRVSSMAKPGGAAFVPTDITGLKRWYAVRRETAYASTDPITSLTDFSGNAENATAAGANCPTYTINVQNSLPSGKGDGNDIMTFTGVNLGTTHTVFLVCKPAAAEDKVLISGAVASGYAPYIENTGTKRIYYANTVGTSVFVAHDHGGTSHIYAIRRNGTTVQFYNNGSQIDVDKTLADNGALTLGTLYAYSDDSFNTSGHILEVCLFDSNISDANMTLMWTYLNGLYAVY